MSYPWGDRRRFNSYSGYFRGLFGTRVQKLSVNAGFTCPNRDGTISSGGCTFCNNEAFCPSYCDPAKGIARQLHEGIEFHRNRYRSADRYLAYFQSFSNTHAPLDRLKEVCCEASSVEGIAGIILGTRPDCVDAEKLDYFAGLARERFIAIEYGIESCYDSTLLAVNRGHDFRCSEEAVAETKKRGIHTGAHFILGLPGETKDMMLAQAEAINRLGPDTVKFHQLQIFKNTPMEAEYHADPSKFHFFALDEYLDFFIDLLERLDPAIVIERFAGEAPPRFRTGPDWGNIRNEQLLAMLEKRLEERDTFQGRLFG